MDKYFMKSIRMYDTDTQSLVKQFGAAAAREDHLQATLATPGTSSSEACPIKLNDLNFCRQETAVAVHILKRKRKAAEGEGEHYRSSSSRSSSSSSSPASS